MLFRYCSQNSDIISSIPTCYTLLAFPVLRRYTRKLFLFIARPFSVHLIWIFTTDIDRYTRYLLQIDTRDIYCRYRSIHKTSKSMWHCFVAGLFKFPQYLSKTFHIAFFHAVSASVWPVAHFFLPNNELPRLQTFCTARCHCFSKVSGKTADPCCR